MSLSKTFFSYSRTDSAFALKLAKDLREAGANVWLDQLDIKPGNRWDTSIQTALGDAVCLIVILSPESASSENVMDEVSFALENGKTVIPVLLSECQTPFRISRLQRVDFTGNYQLGLNNLLNSLGLAHENHIGSEESFLPGSKVEDNNRKTEERHEQLTAHQSIETIYSKEVNEKKRNANKYLLIGGSVIFIALIIWGIIQFGSRDKENTKTNQEAESNEINTTLKTGDVYQGGVIFYIDKSGEHGLIAKEQDLGLFAWEDAKKKCAELGEGWHLPTIVELTMLYQNRDKVGGFNPNGDYWSSSEVAGDNTKAYGFLFNTGQQDFGTKDIEGSIRAVKTF